MNELKKKKLAIGALSVVIVASLGFSIYTSTNLDKTGNDTDKDKPKTSVVSSQDDKDKENKKPVHMNPMDGKEDPSLSERKNELSSMEIREAEREVRNFYREFKFDEGMNFINDLQETSKFTGDAEVLGKLQFDGSLITNLQHQQHAGEEVNGIAILNLMSSFKDPETLLLATLSLDSKIRPYVIQFQGSLNPVYQEGETPRIVRQETEEIPHEIKVMYPETKTYHKIIFSLEEFLLEAYVLESNNGILTFYMIEDPTNKSHYYTVSQWKKINENMRNGRPAMEGVLEMKDSSYIPTTEVIEEEIPAPEEEVTSETTEEEEEPTE